ncbi:MAG: penicillin-insensitive murein endopeptidase, partial [Deltaproteobacteria bacterium]|nr:penicillin-insensitive murein endopeptidase [Deltaproteobacteria bacterium]
MMPLTLASCALVAPQVEETEPPNLSAIAAPAPQDVQAPVATQALELDGDQRVAEPIGRLARRGASDAIDAFVMPLQSRYHPRLASDAAGSISVGTVTAGYLVDAAEIPVQGEHHRVLDKVVPRQTRYTTDDMRDLLLCAAERVAKEHRGAVLQLGNLSRPGGGPLPWSVSHHNGRDADIAFYVRDAKGRLALMDHLYHFDSRGKATDSPEALTFDPEAN